MSGKNLAYPTKWALALLAAFLPPRPAGRVAAPALFFVLGSAIPLRGTAQKEGASAATGRLKYNSQAEIVDVKGTFTGTAEMMIAFKERHAAPHHLWPKNYRIGESPNY